MHDRITVRMTAEMIARIDAWIAEQPDYVSRQEAVRRFVDYSLKHADQIPAPQEEQCELSSQRRAGPLL